MAEGWNAAQREQEILQLRAERNAADDVARTAQAYVGAMERKLKAAREFVIRHHGLTLIDLAEFDTFLKMDAALDAVSSSPERGK